MTQPHYTDDDLTLYLGDCLDALPALPAESVDAIVTDPPYGLAELPLPRVVKALAEWLAGNRAFVPDGRGFMGKQWDTFVPPPAAWDECLRVLKPGGHLLAFAGTRAFDLMTLSIRLAGFEVRDAVADLTGQEAPGLMWCYGSGFPKSLDVSKAIDKTSGQNLSWFGPWLRQERERRGISSHELCERGGFYKNVNHGGLVVNWELGIGMPTAAQFNKVCEILDLPYDRIEVLEREVIGTKRAVPGVAFSSVGPTELEVTAPASEAAKEWDGWGTALKPAWEPIIVARKPLAGTVAANMLEHGTGALNIDGCRVPGNVADERGPAWANSGKGEVGPWHGTEYSETRSAGERTSDLGRWPANLVLSHLPECRPAGVRGVRSNGHHPAARGKGGVSTSGHSGQDGLTERKAGVEEVEAWECAGGCPVAEMDRQSGATRSAYPGRPDKAAGYAGTECGDGDRQVYSPGLGRASASYSDAGGASRFFPVFKYTAKAPTKERPRLDDGTSHPTVKPVELMRWLVKLVAPRGAVVLDPFAGSGSTGEACVMERRRCILIERDPKSADLIGKRFSKAIETSLFD